MPWVEAPTEWYPPADTPPPDLIPDYIIPRWIPTIYPPLDLPPNSPRRDDPVDIPFRRVKPTRTPGSPYREVGPAARPRRLPGPGTAPGPLPAPAPGPGPADWPITTPLPAPVPLPPIHPFPDLPGPNRPWPPPSDGGLDPETQPGVEREIIIRPDADIEVRERPSRHRQRRPPRRVRERKVKAPDSVIHRIYGRVTEAEDFVDALYEAIPKDCKRRHNPRKANGAYDKSLYAKYQTVLRCNNRLDMSKAVQNIIWNQVEDYVIGKASQLGTQWWAQQQPSGTGSYVGPNTGPATGAGFGVPQSRF